MTPASRILQTALIAILVAGCSNVRPISATDEFLVITKSPLSVPPEYNLRPPAPSMSLPLEIPVAEQARRIVFGTDTGKTASPGERALVAAAGGDAVPESLRAVIDFEAASRVAKNTRFTSRLLFLLGMIENEVLNPEAEAAKLAEELEDINQLTGGQAVIITPGNQPPKLPGT